jgi:uncharacterized protein (TIGR00288 family)
MADNEEKRIALLIDADNAPAAKIDLILAEVARYGVANVRRAYGNWKSANLRSWEEKLHEYAIRPIQQFAYSKGKNASDMAMVIDAMDLLYARNLDGFAIVSSDADFTPLVMRLLTDGVKVYGFGEKKTPEPFVNACSKFIYVEGLARPAGTEAAADIADTDTADAADPAATASAAADVATDDVAADDAAAEHKAAIAPRSAGELRSDTRLLLMLRTAISAAAGADGWSLMSKVGNLIANQASFDPRNYGYRKLGELIEAMGLFEVRRNNLLMSVREKPRGKAAAKTTPKTTAEAAAPAAPAAAAATKPKKAAASARKPVKDAG